MTLELNPAGGDEEEVEVPLEKLLDSAGTLPDTAVTGSQAATAACAMEQLGWGRVLRLSDGTPYSTAFNGPASNGNYFMNSPQYPDGPVPKQGPADDRVDDSAVANQPLLN